MPIPRRALLATTAALSAQARAQTAGTLRFEVQGLAPVVEQTAMVVRARLAALGIDTALVSVDGAALHVVLPPRTDAARVAHLLVRTGKLALHLTVEPGSPAAARAIARRNERDGTRMLLAPEAALTGAIVDTAIATHDAATRTARIDVKFRPDAAVAFARLTADSVGRAIAIVLDDRVLSAPVVLEPIRDGRVAIIGSFPLAEAQEIAALLAGGPLPSPLNPPRVLP